jgi:hypothetical protein
MLISGISRAYNNHFNTDQIAQDLNSGKYYLVSLGSCDAPILLGLMMRSRIMRPKQNGNSRPIP